MLDYTKPLALKHNRIPEMLDRVHFEYKTPLGNFIISWRTVGHSKTYSVFDSEGKSLECVEWYLVNTPSSKSYYVNVLPTRGPYASRQAAEYAIKNLSGVTATIKRV